MFCGVLCVRWKGLRVYFFVFYLLWVLGKFGLGRVEFRGKCRFRDWMRVVCVELGGRSGK